MRVLLLTDIHGEVEKLGKILEKEDYDVALCAGDLSDASEFSDYGERLEKVLETFDRQGKMAKTVPGNMDPEEACVRSLIEYRMNIHKKIASFDQFDVVGFGGGQTPFGTPFEPEGSEIQEVLGQLYPRMKSENRFAVIHQPPAETELDVANGEHVGSPEVRNLIEEREFKLVLTGHIHESRGRDRLNGTEVINPGPVLEGYYAVAEMDRERPETEMKSL